MRRKTTFLMSYPFLYILLQNNLGSWTYQNFSLQIVPHEAYFNIEELPFHSKSWITILLF
jgi:hypothetical protein